MSRVGRCRGSRGASPCVHGSWTDECNPVTGTGARPACRRAPRHATMLQVWASLPSVTPSSRPSASRGSPRKRRSTISVLRRMDQRPYRSGRPRRLRPRSALTSPPKASRVAASSWCRASCPRGSDGCLRKPCSAPVEHCVVGHQWRRASNHRVPDGCRGKLCSAARDIDAKERRVGTACVRAARQPLAGRRYDHQTNHTFPSELWCSESMARRHCTALDYIRPCSGLRNDRPSSAVSPPRESQTWSRNRPTTRPTDSTLHTQYEGCRRAGS